MPLIGASGAIAGLMGALPVLYGRRKVNFFCYFGFYFTNFLVLGNCISIFHKPVGNFYFGNGCI